MSWRKDLVCCDIAEIAFPQETQEVLTIKKALSSFYSQANGIHGYDKFLAGALPAKLKEAKKWGHVIDDAMLALLLRMTFTDAKMLWSVALAKDGKTVQPTGLVLVSTKMKCIAAKSGPLARWKLLRLSRDLRRERHRFCYAFL